VTTAALGGVTLGGVIGVGHILKAATKDPKNVLMIVVGDLNDWVGLVYPCHLQE
jgi:hypothetical protein